MKFREIHRRIRTESAYMNPILLGICAGVAVLLGAIFTTNLIGRPAGFLLPRTALPSFLHILFQLAAYALFGAAFAILWKAPLPQKTYRLRLQKKCALVLFVCVLVLCYVWIPLVYKAASFFLALLVLAVLFFCLAAIFMTVWREHSTAAVLLCFFALWIAYLFYYTFSLFLLN